MLQTISERAAVIPLINHSEHIHVHISDEQIQHDIESLHSGLSHGAYGMVLNREVSCTHGGVVYDYYVQCDLSMEADVMEVEPELN